jgi:hypothetical protein
LYRSRGVALAQREVEVEVASSHWRLKSVFIAKKKRRCGCASTRTAVLADETIGTLQNQDPTS